MSMSKELTTDALPKASARLSVENISLEDLDMLERDLLFLEKVSVCFLLCHEIRDASFVLQQLMVAFRVLKGNIVSGTRRKPHDTTIISSWARSQLEYKWKEHLVEALAIVKCNRVLQKLGFDLQDLRETYHPLIDEFCVHVHPILKILFRMCEKLSSAEGLKMIHHMRRKYDDCGEFGVDSHKYLELYLLNWLQSSKGIISIGDAKGAGAHFEQLLAFLKENEMDEFYEKLKRFTTIASDANIEEKITGKMTRRCEEMTISSDSFQIDTQNMGYALILNQSVFYREENRKEDYLFLTGDLETRYGTEKDVESLEKTLSAFKFTVIVKNNLKDNEILATIREYVDKTTSKHSSLIVVLLSHGFEGAIYGANSIPVEIRTVKNILCTEKLRNKPKVLIIQACQSNEGFTQGRLVSDAPSRFSNLLTAWSTVEGHLSMRHTKQGTWYIQTLCAKILELHTSEHLQDILTRVANDVSAKKGDDGERMVPKIDSTLQKKLFLPPLNL
ncbi:caspase-8 [Phlebotomus argentipes]|uniref:caspase-8 n=1 Tax=Phlebotomus argentipes TaxID=94469 RepID=UPI0028937F71|nr:caspase-8 [Phlebotomus argentipes]